MVPSVCGKERRLSGLLLKIFIIIIILVARTDDIVVVGVRHGNHDATNVHHVCKRFSSLLLDIIRTSRGRGRGRRFFDGGGGGRLRFLIFIILIITILVVDNDFASVDFVSVGICIIIIVRCNHAT